MDEKDILERISELVAEERDLRARGRLAGADQERLRALEERLDQCWDLLRQRRARAEFGQDPDQAKPRPPGEVESYLQ